MSLASYAITTTPGQNVVAPNATNNATGGDSFDSTIEYITYACAGVSILSISLTLLSYVGYRKFNVKRPHIIMVNLCVCLLLYFISYVMSNPSRHLVSAKSEHQVEVLCILGAFLCHLSLLGTWFWLTAYWFILLIMYKKPVGGHISHFVFKSALPCYGIPILFAAVSILIAHLKHDINKPEDDGYVSNACFVANNYLYVGLVMPFFASTIPVVFILTFVICGLCRMQNEQESTQLQQRLNGMRRVKSHLIKLSVITFLTALLVVDSAFIPVVRQMQGGSKVVVLAILFSVISIGLGVLLLYLFCIRQEELRDYWLDKVLGSKSFRNRSFNHNNLVNSSRKRRSLGRNNTESYHLHNNDADNGRSGYKIIPKQDTDLTALNLDQIPGTPTPSPPRKLQSEAEVQSSSSSSAAVTPGKSRTLSSTSAGTHQQRNGQLNVVKSRTGSSSSSKHSTTDDIVPSTIEGSSLGGVGSCRTVPRCEKNGSIRATHDEDKKEHTPGASTAVTLKVSSCASLASSRDSTLEVTEFI